jgi:hypothetical protein
VVTVLFTLSYFVQAQTNPDSSAEKVRMLDTMTVTTKKLDEARSGMSPTTGTSLYHIDATSVQTLAQGAETPINHVLLTAPGVAQDSYGQLHVRGEHADLQFSSQRNSTA